MASQIPGNGQISLFTTTNLNADIKLQEKNIVLADMLSTYSSLLAALDQDGQGELPAFVVVELNPDFLYQAFTRFHK